MMIFTENWHKQITKGVNQTNEGSAYWKQLPWLEE